MKIIFLISGKLVILKLCVLKVLTKLIVACLFSLMQAKNSNVFMREVFAISLIHQCTTEHLRETKTNFFMKFNFRTYLSITSVTIISTDFYLRTIVAFDIIALYLSYSVSNNTIYLPIIK